MAILKNTTVLTINRLSNLLNIAGKSVSSKMETVLINEDGFFQIFCVFFAGSDTSETILVGTEESCNAITLRGRNTAIWEKITLQSPHEEGKRGPCSAMI